MRTMTQTSFNSKLYRKTRHLYRDVNRLLRFNEKAFKNARGSRILIYHGICMEDHTKFNPIFLKYSTFERHLQFYQKYFNVVSLDDYFAGNFSQDKFNICITFDDGYANNHKYVLSLLKKYQLPAAFFVTAIRDSGYDILWNDFLWLIQKYGPKEISYKNERFYKGVYNRYISAGSGLSLIEMLRSGGFDVKAEMMELLYPLVPFRESKPYDIDYWLQMTGEQIRELASSPLATIGSHAYYHNDLSRIQVKDAAEELQKSKQFLENIVDKPVNSLAFPYGTYTQGVVQVANDAGYNQLLAMDFQSEEDRQNPAMRERFTVNPFISPVNQMHATIARSYD
jgi:peptidoglycan/xylan/chitin deacetylase (PgdA/CDA1 family)